MKNPGIFAEKVWPAPFFQIVKPFASKSVLYNVTVGAFATTDKRTDAEDKALSVLKSLNFEDKKDLRSGSLTIADRKRLEIARALATSPKLLLLDEVMAGLRPGEVDELVGIIQELRNSGVTNFCHRTYHAGHHGPVRQDRGDSVRQKDCRGHPCRDRFQ